MPVSDHHGPTPITRRPGRGGALVTGLCLALVLVLVGCSNNVTLREWQSEFEQYVVQEANGDLNAMRGLVSDEGRATFSVYGSKDPYASTDVAGLWLGSYAYNDRVWQIFLVSRLQERTVVDVRLAAASRPPHGQWRWHMSEPAPDMLKTYRRFHQRRQPTPREMGQPDTAFQLLDWPAPADDFRLRTDGPRVTAIEQGSGARWLLSLAPEHRQQTAAADDTR